MTSRMLDEARESGAVVAHQIAANRGPVRAIADALRRLDAPFAVTLARGSSDQAASFAKVLLETRLRVPVVSHAPSIGSLYKATSPRLADVPLIAISQSGRSPDLLAAAQDARRVGAVVIALVNDEASPLAALADHVVPLRAGPEQSVAATKSFIASLVAVAQLCAAWAGDSPLERALDGAGAAIDQAVALDWEAALPMLTPASSMLVLGRGLTLPIAGEAALKLKETSGLHGEAFSIAEVAHGPMTLITAGQPVLVFAPQDAAREGVADRIASFAARGAHVIAAGPLEDVAAATVRLPTVQGLHPVIAAICDIASFYPLADALARARGRDPDHPPYLAKVTHTV